MGLSLLRLDFPSSLRENAIIWMLGTYITLVEQEVVSKENKLNLSSVIGFFKQKKDHSGHLAMPFLGPIPGIDSDALGIG